MDDQTNDYIGEATYSPEDNKLRLYPYARLDAETYAAVKAAGFSWAPKQGVFVAGMWTPGREDLLIKLCGEIGDEGKTLAERAEDRAERFEQYSENRQKDADAAYNSFRSIADHIPFGQPILVDHYSARRSFKNQERMHNLMGASVKNWEQSKYWADRAERAKAHAEYKADPAVRSRRIKTIEADMRKRQRELADVENRLAFWMRDDITREQAIEFVGWDDKSPCMLADGTKEWSTWHALSNGKITVESLTEQRRRTLPKLAAHFTRWINHYQNRLTFERAMLDEDGGLLTDHVKPVKGGAIKSRLWGPRGGWSYVTRVNKLSVTIRFAWNEGGKLFNQTIPFEEVLEIMSPEQIAAEREAGRLVETENGVGFYLVPVAEAVTA